MARRLLPFVVLVSLCASASAQGAFQGANQGALQRLNPDRAPGATRHAGIYHVASGTWTRTPGAVASFGPDVIYSNTAPSGYFTGVGSPGGFAAGSLVFDEGNVPGLQSTQTPGDRDDYSVNSFQIGYCDMNGPATGGWEISFYGGHAPCSGLGVASATFNVTDLPASGGCWTITIDLSGGSEFCLPADGGDGFDDDPDHDAFGWSYRYIGSGTGVAGFLLTGDPESTEPNWLPGAIPTAGTNTYFGPPSLCGPGLATGRHTRDFFFLGPGPGTTYSGCHWFGGYRNNNSCGGPSNPYASFHMELQAGPGGCGGDSSYCLSNPNSTGVNSTLEYFGSLSVAENDFTLVATVPQNVVGMFITSRDQGYVANPAGMTGNLCLGGSIGRFQTLVASSGSTGRISISTASGAWSLGRIPSANGPYAAVAGTEANFQLWHRDTSPSGVTSNFTDGLTVTWLP